MKRKIVIFASGTGSNTINIIKYFEGNRDISVSHVFSNKKDAPVLEKAEKLGVISIAFDRNALYSDNQILHILKDIKPEIIVLAGFLWIFPDKIISEFPNKVINIHPALLPNYGGKGMYGMKVHEAIVKDKATETGISIHFVNEKYDEGEIIFQKSIPVDPSDTPSEVAQKIHQLEHEYFPQVIEKLLNSKSGS
ncbi:MAG TPA: phosphoribosylglycinamide formyltransferase [Salinimicrobium sp.]|nr:phosphoribosylglycinamide formyltransferase [Salinimicrobium sp.]